MDIFQNIPKEERRQVLEDSCDTVIEHYNFIKRLSEEELEEIALNHADNDVQISRIERRKKELLDEIKIELAPFKERREDYLTKLRNKTENTTDTVYLMKDFDADKVRLYAPDGTCIEERRMRPEERQTSMIRQLRNGTED